MILLDTHVLVWLLSDDRRIGKQTREAVDRSWARGEAAVSAITFWEVAMLENKGSAFRCWLTSAHGARACLRRAWSRSQWTGRWGSGRDFCKTCTATLPTA